jgi:hypothetical protein
MLWRLTAVGGWTAGRRGGPSQASIADPRELRRCVVCLYGHVRHHLS